MLKVKLFRITHIVLFMFLAMSSFAEGTNLKDTVTVSVFEKANVFFEKEQFSKALSSYESLVEKGAKSENLYYNIANTYFKNGALGKSILYYEKTLKINPQNNDAFHNLRLANTKIEDNLAILPDLFFVSWWKKLKHLFSINTWAWIAISFGWFSVMTFGFYLFSRNLLFKKAAFSKSILFGLVSLLSILIAGIQSEKIFKTEEIVLINSSSYGKDAPSENAANEILFHEGTKLEVLDQVDGFYKVINTEGNTVWVNSTDFLLV